MLDTMSYLSESCFSLFSMKWYADTRSYTATSSQPTLFQAFIKKRNHLSFTKGKAPKSSEECPHPTCSSQFSHTQDIYDHYESVHGASYMMDPDPTAKTPLHCVHCKKAFKKARAVHFHQIKHRYVLLVVTTYSYFPRSPERFFGIEEGFFTLPALLIMSHDYILVHKRVC